MFFPIGAGLGMPVASVFGAKQFHPTLQADQIQGFYGFMYGMTNIGILVGDVVVPIVAEKYVSAAYFIPVIAMAIGLFFFVLGSKRYVRYPPDKTVIVETAKLVGKRLCLCQSFNQSKSENGGLLKSSFVDGVRRTFKIGYVCHCVVLLCYVFISIHLLFIFHCVFHV